MPDVVKGSGCQVIIGDPIRSPASGWRSAIGTPNFVMARSPATPSATIPTGMGGGNQSSAVRLRSRLQASPPILGVLVSAGCLIAGRDASRTDGDQVPG